MKKLILFIVFATCIQTTLLFATMQVRVKVSGVIPTHGDRVLIFRLGDNATVQTLKYKIHSKIAVPKENFRLEWRGKYLKNNRTLMSYNIPNNALIQMIFIPTLIKLPSTKPEKNIKRLMRGYGVRY